METKHATMQSRDRGVMECQVDRMRTAAEELGCYTSSTRVQTVSDFYYRATVGIQKPHNVSWSAVMHAMTQRLFERPEMAAHCTTNQGNTNQNAIIFK